MYIFRTTSGQKFKFDENARDLLEEGAPIMTERIFRSLIELRYHCPYKRCHGRFYYSANDIRSHLESRHPVVNPSEGDFSKLIFTTAAGKRIKLEDENITNSLDDDMAINISVETRSRPKSNETRIQ
ncbi:hypothetical protein BDB00DRAFT_393494 [Zychaea mexicana]|uniref:uncharacterized protein n=1 Tax=Zychaea mexicana TaxID=64656 RepID=UPI0022FF3CE7|nr:uncharacterized protein BDB00DRAFT_393494 [Zychaea mexicana]KAI9498621.1 hypothetical protein BDB00DRAFT_393494 [Zychaea mexicana]